MGRNWRWVSRDDDRKLVDVWAGEEKPDEFVEDGDTIFDGGRYVGVCHAEFLSLTGIDVQPATCVRVEFAAKVLEE